MDGEKDGLLWLVRLTGALMINELFAIDDGLRRHLHAFEQLLSVSFSTDEVDRVFKDANEDQVSQKSYSFHESTSLSVAGLVDDYEPETIWIRVRGTRAHERSLKGYIDSARLLKPREPL